MSPSTEAVAAQSIRDSISATWAPLWTVAVTSTPPTASAAVPVLTAVVAAAITRIPLGRIGTNTSRTIERLTITYTHGVPLRDPRSSSNVLLPVRTPPRRRSVRQGRPYSHTAYAWPQWPKVWGWDVWEAALRAEGPGWVLWPLPWE